MSKITNNHLIRSGTAGFIAVPIWQEWASKGYDIQYDTIPVLESLVEHHASDTLTTHCRSFARCHCITYLLIYLRDQK